MANILSIGQSGLTAAQVGISATGNNITNASTPGYSRQIVIQSENTGQNLGVGYLGQGTQVSKVMRDYNDFLNTQVITAQSSSSELTSYYTQINQINNQLADSSSGLSPALQNFFSGVQSLSANPNNTASRQAVFSAANTLTASFQNLSSQLTQMGQSVNTQISSTVDSINIDAQKIATLNAQILSAQGVGSSNPANDLLDQRDLAIADLSKQVQVSVIKEDTGSYSILIGNGQPLVVGAQQYKLTTAVASTDASRTEVAYQSGSGTLVFPENSLSGGALGGLLEFRSNSLDPAQNTLGRIAISFASAFNAQNKLGQDQNGALGGNIFTLGSPVVIPKSGNTGTANITAAISDANALTTSNYQLQTITAPVGVTPGAYQVTRLSDGAVTSFTTFPETIDGVSFNISSGTQVAGDTYLIKPTVNGASTIAVATSDTTKLATAAPIVTAAPAANTGSGTISAGSVNAPPPTNTNLQQPATITFTSATQFSVTGTGTGAPTGVSYTAGANITYNGWTVQISGAPAVGDTFTVGPNTNGVGDNRNALLLGALQSANTMAGSTTSFQGAYAQLVSQVGNKTSELKATSTSQSAVLDSAVQAQQSVSGVNLDEEATNLLRYQQAYQASGKLIQTANTLFSQLLSMLG